MTSFSRRSFAESLAVAALAPMLNLNPGSIRLESWTREAAGLVRENPGALAKALTEAIRAQYGSRLSAKDLKTIAHQIQTGLERVTQLKKVNLSNGDEPDFVFTPSRPATESHD